MVQGQMTQIYENQLFIVILIDSHWYGKSLSFSHSVKSTDIDHIAVLADSNDKENSVWNITFIKNYNNCKFSWIKWKYIH